MPKKIPFPLESGETVVNSWGAASVHGISMTTGRIWVTSQRLIFQPTVLWVFWIAPLVGLLLWLMAKNKWRYIPLRSIGAEERSSFGRNQNIMKLGTPSGELRFLIDKYDDFAAALETQRRAVA